MTIDDPHLKEFRELLAELERESPRGKVLISTGMIDDLLRRAIEARLVDHPDVTKLTDGFNAPLGTLSARIVAALALGVISAGEYADLQIIRKVRNDFAHRMSASFDDLGIKDRCFALKFAASNYGDVVVNAEGQFTTAAMSLILYLTNRPHYVGERRLTPEQWPY